MRALAEIGTAVVPMNTTLHAQRTARLAPRAVRSRRLGILHATWHGVSLMAAPAFKYAPHHLSLTDCPPSAVKEADQDAFRFVFDPVCPKSFTPQAIGDPERYKKKAAPCGDYSLSLFDTQAQARTVYAELQNRHKKIAEKLGTHLAHVTLKRSYGCRAQSDEDGHFEFHEYDGINLHLVAKIVGSLP